MLVAERFLLTPNCSACHGSVISASFHLCFLDCCCVFVCFSLLCSHVSSPAWSSPLTCLASVQSVRLSSVTPPAQHLLVSTVCIYVQSLVQSLSICCVCVIHWSPCSCFHKALELLGKQQNSKKKKKPSLICKEVCTLTWGGFILWSFRVNTQNVWWMWDLLT